MFSYNKESEQKILNQDMSLVSFKKLKNIFYKTMIPLGYLTWVYMGTRKKEQNFLSFSQHK